jgi:hypothetical protein
MPANPAVRKERAMYPTKCPKCKATFLYIGDDGIEYSRVIGIYDMDTDMTEEWQCPDCNHIWSRWPRESESAE